MVISFIQPDEYLVGDSLSCVKYPLDKVHLQMTVLILYQIIITLSKIGSELPDLLFRRIVLYVFI